MFKVKENGIDQSYYDEILTFIEIQQGEYFGEDDIIRLEDDYGRVSSEPGPKPLRHIC
ncbi:MAG: hypothetical protein NUV86_07630 [Candidatus Scalindua sp.]|nr:hypothetical protein [Candidatus Scalindua sp.]MCR4344366.1 hypothetical protein [Candidatus Scalindua sp.]